MQEGLIIHFDEEQRKIFLKDNDENSVFSDALSVYDWELKKLQVVLLSFSGQTIDYISLAVRGDRVATAKSRVEFSDLVDLHSIPIKDVEGYLEPNTKLHFMRSSSGHGGRIPHKTWLSVLNVIKKLRPTIADEVERLTTLKTISGYHLTGSAADVLLQQREALGTALDIFCGSNQLRKEVLKAWAPDPSNLQLFDKKNLEATLSDSKKNDTNFLAGISARHIQEESAIQHDLYNWENEKASLHDMGISTFQQGGRVLEVIYANRNSLERTLGIDLIYCNKSFDAFVLVQYKLMKGQNDREGYFYRPDEQLEKELARMNEFREKYKNNNKLNSHEHYRLNSDGFFFKLVPASRLKVASEKLISGMYIAREYMEFLLGSSGPSGEQGGRLISFRNSPRYLTNSEFSNSVSKGWIGSNLTQSKGLSDLIKSFLETGHALMVAVEDRIVY